MAKNKRPANNKQKAPFYYMHDIAGLWIYMRSGDNDTLITQIPITDPGVISEVKNNIEGEQ